MSYGGWQIVNRKYGKKVWQWGTSSAPTKTWGSSTWPKRKYYVCSSCEEGKNWVYCDKALDQNRCRCGTPWPGKGSPPPKKTTVDVEGGINTSEDEDIEVHVKATMDLIVQVLGDKLPAGLVEEAIRDKFKDKAKETGKTHLEVYKEARNKLEAADRLFIKSDKQLQHLLKVKKDLADKLSRNEQAITDVEKARADALQEKDFCLEELKRLNAEGSNEARDDPRKSQAAEEDEIMENEDLNLGFSTEQCDSMDPELKAKLDDLKKQFKENEQRKKDLKKDQDAGQLPKETANRDRSRSRGREETSQGSASSTKDKMEAIKAAAEAAAKMVNGTD